MGIGLSTLEDKTFLLLITAISLAFAWLLWPFYGAILWGTVLAIVFAPLYRRLCRSMRPNLAALATVVIIVLIVILPSTLITRFPLSDAAPLHFDRCSRSCPERRQISGAASNGLPWPK